MNGERWCAVELLLAAKAGANLSRPYLKSLRYYLTRFIKGRESRRLEAITPTEIEAFLKQFELANSRAMWLNRLSHALRLRRLARLHRGEPV